MSIFHRIPDLGNGILVSWFKQLIPALLLGWMMIGHAVESQAQVILEIEDVQFRLRTESAEPDSQYVTLSPNPASNYVKLTASPTLDLSQVEITNVAGQTIFSISVQGPSQHSVELSPGLYYVEAHGAQGQVFVETLQIIQ